MDKILSNLGLCQKAGGLISGYDIVYEGIKNNKVLYIFLASDASNNTKKQVYDKAKSYNIEVCDKFSSDELNKSTGNLNKMVFGVVNRGFLKILK